jgi:hypothetical protein
MARAFCHLRRDSDISYVATQDTVELRGFEPLTFCMPCSRVSSDDVALGPVAAVQSGPSVRGRLARSGEISGRWSLVGPGLPDLPVKGGSTMALRITHDMMTLGSTTTSGRRPV